MAMTRHHVPLKPLSLSLVFLLFALVVTPALSVPSISLNVQSIESCTAGRYYIDVNITNLEGATLVNQTFNVTIPADRIPAYSLLKAGNVYAVDENGNPLYYWVMRRTSKVFTVFFRVPRIEANGWRVVRIYYGSDNPYRGYRKPGKLFVYFENFNRLKNYPHVDTGIFGNSQSFADGELQVKNGRLAVNSTLSSGTSKEAQLTTLTVDGSYEIVFKFRRGSDAQNSTSYPFYMFIYDPDWEGYDYIGIREKGSRFKFEFGNDWNGRKMGSKAGKQYYLGEILVTPYNSTGRVEKFSNGKTLVSHGFENYYEFFYSTVSVGFGQANGGSSTVNLLAYVDWVYVVHRVNYDAEIGEMGVECGCN
ncbi:DUF2341 domain-containing protein [Thermococcus profundus]|nr:DUF2341 domain-containing protein [Thermococcus profundus]